MQTCIHHVTHAFGCDTKCVWLCPSVTVFVTGCVCVCIRARARVCVCVCVFTHVYASICICMTSSSSTPHSLMSHLYFMRDSLYHNNALISDVISIVLNHFNLFMRFDVEGTLTEVCLRKE